MNVGKNEKKALAAASREFLDLLLEKKRTRTQMRAHGKETDTKPMLSRNVSDTTIFPTFPLLEIVHIIKFPFLLPLCLNIVFLRISDHSIRTMMN